MTPPPPSSCPPPDSTSSFPSSPPPFLFLCLAAVLFILLLLVLVLLVRRHIQRKHEDAGEEDLSYSVVQIFPGQQQPVRCSRELHTVPDVVYSSLRYSSPVRP
ncbi:hypothetical protein GOODEAATRI_034551 [Goodea atripinnis]|uniref:Uncharacterized protein n=1 Tax=Goodea atripinnis TaxID=208336 RepID=A0ABV0MYY0_9TELE